MTSTTQDYVRLAWNDRASNESGFLLKQSGRRSSLLKLRADESQLQFDHPPCGQELELRLVAFNHDGPSESSNTVTITTSPCSAGPKADLVIEAMNIFPDPVGTGLEFTTRFTVVNRGAARASASSALWEIAGMFERRTCPVPALDPGESHSCSIDLLAAPLAPMNYGVWAYADETNALDEGVQGERNNEATVVLKVLPRAVN